MLITNLSYVVTAQSSQPLAVASLEACHGQAVPPSLQHACYMGCDWYVRQPQILRRVANLWASDGDCCCNHRCSCHMHGISMWSAVLCRVLHHHIPHAAVRSCMALRRLEQRSIYEPLWQSTRSGYGLPANLHAPAQTLRCMPAIQYQ